MRIIVLASRTFCGLSECTLGPQDPVTGSPPQHLTTSLTSPHIPLPSLCSSLTASLLRLPASSQAPSAVPLHLLFPQVYLCVCVPHPQLLPSLLRCQLVSEVFTGHPMGNSCSLRPPILFLCFSLSSSLHPPYHVFFWFICLLSIFPTGVELP